VSGDDLEHERGVLHILAEWTDLIQRGGERDEAVAGHTSIRRLESNATAEGGGLADRATGIRAERGRRKVRGDRGGRAP
jgi:hypothetical protein